MSDLSTRVQFLCIAAIIIDVLVMHAFNICRLIPILANQIAEHQAGCNFVALCVWVTSVARTVWSLDLIGSRTRSQIVRSACVCLCWVSNSVGHCERLKRSLMASPLWEEDTLNLREDTFHRIIIGHRYVDFLVAIFCLLYCTFCTKVMPGRLSMWRDKHQMCPAKFATNS